MGVSGFRKKRVWAEWEIEYVKAHFCDECTIDIADHIGCSPTTVSNKARELGLKKSAAFRKINFAYRYARKPGVNEEEQGDKEGR